MVFIYLFIYFLFNLQVLGNNDLIFKVGFKKKKNKKKNAKGLFRLLKEILVKNLNLSPHM